MAQYVFTMNRVGKIVPPKRQILKNISLSFFPGAKIGMLGLNGSGKSTLLKIMAGVDKDIEGEATPMPGLKIGYLPQEAVINADQTVREAVEEGIGGVLAAKKRLDEVSDVLSKMAGKPGGKKPKPKKDDEEKSDEEGDGEDGESGARLHLRGRVAQAEHEYETGDHGVA